MQADAIRRLLRATVQSCGLSHASVLLESALTELMSCEGGSSAAIPKSSIVIQTFGRGSSKDLA